MSVHVLHPCEARGLPLELEVLRDPELLEGLRRDAAAIAGAGASGLLLPRDESSLSRWLRENPRERILVQGALTSLTGGAAPDDEVVISSRRMNHLEINPEGTLARVGPGLILAELQAALALRGLFYPPAPTHDGATLGGNVATNAAGAATFRYGTTRDWVSAIRIMLRNGDLLEIRRGATTLRPGDTLRISDHRELLVPSYETPALKKVSAGYFVRDPMDLIDLFIGSEGTLGILTEIEIRLLPRPRVLVGFVLLPDVGAACDLTAALRARSSPLGAQGEEQGIALRSVEFFDGRCLRLLVEEGKLKHLHGHDPSGVGAGLLFEIETPAALSDEALNERLGEAAEAVLTGLPSGNDAMGQLVEVLAARDLLERCELAMPSDIGRREQLFGIREAVPLAISDWLLRRQREEPAVQKAGGDVIVPFEQLGALLQACDEAFRSRGIDGCVFGHISDGNLHPNTFPRNAAELAIARQAQVEIAAFVKSVGGCPLSEHGVGRSRLKKRLLEGFWGPGPIGQMRALKAALDPGFTLARGVFFDPREGN